MLSLEALGHAYLGVCPRGARDMMPTMTAPSEARTLGLATQIEGDVRVPASKSIAQRGLACALMASGETRISGLPTGQDVLHALRCARAGGARFPSNGRMDDLLATALIPRLGRGALVGAPLGARERAREWAAFTVGESGTSARLFTAIGALARPEGSGSEIQPSGSLVGRTSPALFAALRSAGVGVEHAGTDGGWPVLLTAAEPPARIELEEPGSSQEVSALLMALAAHPGRRDVHVVGKIPSRGYVDVTMDVLEKFGAVVTAEKFQSDGHGGSGEHFTVRGPLTAPNADFHVERDASSAAVALAAGVLSTGKLTTVTGVGTGSRQPDAAFPFLMERFGCDGSLSNDKALSLQGPPAHGASIDCSEVPDLAPVFAAVGAFVARGGDATTLTGLGTLPGKESSRIEVLSKGLMALGYDISFDDESLTIRGRTSEAQLPVRLDPHGDHRMAFAFALMSLFEPMALVNQPECVGKSWPSFWRDLGGPSA